MRNPFSILILTLTFSLMACGPDRPEPTTRSENGVTTTSSSSVSADDFDLEYVLEWVQGEGDLRQLEEVINNPEYSVHNVDSNSDGNLDYIRVVEHQEDGAVVIEFVARPTATSETNETAVASIRVRADDQGRPTISGQYPTYVEGSQQHYYPPTVVHHRDGLSFGEAYLLASLLRPHPVYMGMGPVGVYSPRPVWSGRGSFRSHARSSSTTRRTTTTTTRRISPTSRPSSVRSTPTAQRTASRLRSTRSGGSSVGSHRNSGRSFRTTGSSQRDRRAATSRTRSSGSRATPSRPRPTPRATRSSRSRSRGSSFGRSRSSRRSFGGGRSFGGSRGGRRSSAVYKTDIQYLSQDDVTRAAEALYSMPLTTWEYTDEPGQRHFGIIVEDAEGSPIASETVVRGGDHVDLYGLASMNIAANQHQEAQIRMLMERITQLEQAVAVCR